MYDITLIIGLVVYIIKIGCIVWLVFAIGEGRQLGFLTLNDNLAVKLKPTHPPLLNSKGRLTFRKTNCHTLAALLRTHQNLNFLEINSFW